MSRTDDRHEGPAEALTLDRDDVLDFAGADDLVAAGRVTPPGAEAVRAARLAVAQAALMDRPDLRDLAAPVAPKPVRRRRRLLVAAAAVAALAVGGAVYPVVGLGGDPAASASAASFLTSVADVASEGTATQAPYWKVHKEVVNEDDGQRTDTVYFDRAGRIWWMEPDGSVTKQGPKLKRWPVGKDLLTWRQLSSLPADADALAARLGDGAFAQASILLEDAPVRPAVRAALFEILAAQDGVRLVGTVKDSQGRSGTAVEYTTAPSEFTGKRSTIRLVIAPDSGKLLESSSRTAGRPAERATFLEVGPANHFD
ncbi:hypothetical protein [Streptomyces sp. NPDC057694]|uniref:hypothetical protein n=1 Tax=Streptomyces sp. NPDC057694 TaxID=3346216 RepID=UPI0036A14F34